MKVAATLALASIPPPHPPRAALAWSPPVGIRSPIQHSIRSPTEAAGRDPGPGRRRARSSSAAAAAGRSGGRRLGRVGVSPRWGRRGACRTRSDLRCAADPAGGDVVGDGGGGGLDGILSGLTSLFPLYVLSAAILGARIPGTLSWVNGGQRISVMLASVMMGTGMTLERSDFTDAVVDNPASVPAGVLCQFGIMPLASYAVGRTMLLSATTAVDPVMAGAGPALFLGLVLVGCSPGGTASNLVSLIAGADVALSVLLTACSTMLASAVTPMLVKLLVGSTVQVSGVALCAATARVVLLPVGMGMALNAAVPGVAASLSRFTPLASALLVALICGGVVAQNASAALGGGVGGAGSPALLPAVLTSVVLLHALGFLLGYIVPRWILRYPERTSRTMSIETGMQNSALAVVLARSVGAPALAGLPGALSATCHSCLGSALAAYWRYGDGKRTRSGGDGRASTESE